MTTNKELIFKHLQKQYDVLMDTIEDLGYISKDDAINMKGFLSEKKLEYDLAKPCGAKAAIMIKEWGV